MLVRRWVSVQVLMHFFWHYHKRMCFRSHDALEDAVGAFAAIYILFQVGCVDVERAAHSQEASWLSVSHVEGCGAAENAGSKVGFAVEMVLRAEVRRPAGYEEVMGQL